MGKKCLIAIITSDKGVRGKQCHVELRKPNVTEDDYDGRYIEDELITSIGKTHVARTLKSMNNSKQKADR